jgi:hypothetical protein
LTNELLFNDGGESFCEGDPDPADIDWDQVAELEARQRAVLALPEGDRPMAMLAYLEELYGGQAVVL